jgi:hypothetical protein
MQLYPLSPQSELGRGKRQRQREREGGGEKEEERLLTMED